MVNRSGTALKKPGKLAAIRFDANSDPQALKMPGYLANHAAIVFNRLVDAALRPQGISMALLAPMLILARRGPMLQRDLVRASAVAQPAMVALLDKLEAAGMIERTPDLSDRRAARAALTVEGHRQAASGIRVLSETNQAGLQGFSQEQSGMLTTLLERLITNFEDVDR